MARREAFQEISNRWNSSKDKFQKIAINKGKIKFRLSLLASGNKTLMELIQQIFPTWHIYLDMFLVGFATYGYLRIKKKIKTK